MTITLLKCNYISFLLFRVEVRSEQPQIQWVGPLQWALTELHDLIMLTGITTSKGNADRKKTKHSRESSSENDTIG